MIYFVGEIWGTKDGEADLGYQRIDGKQVAAEIRRELKEEVLAFKERTGIVPGLAIILVGHHHASELYVKGKIRACQEVGIHSTLVRLEEEVLEKEVFSHIQKLNQDPSVHGILVQLPLPSYISPDGVVEAIDPSKDVDGFHPYNMGRLLMGTPSFIPCTPRGIMELLKRSEVEIAGKHAVVIGRSQIVGKPMAFLLQQAQATVTMCHSRTIDLPRYTKQADLLVVAVGQPHMISRQHVKPGVVVVDVGINRDERLGLIGDVDFEDVAPLTRAITPVPGGVGPMTIAMLLKNTIDAAKKLV